MHRPSPLNTSLETKPSSYFAFQTSFFCGFLFFCGMFVPSSVSVALPNDCLWVYFGYQNKRQVSCSKARLDIADNKESRPPQSKSCSETNGNLGISKCKSDPVHPRGGYHKCGDVLMRRLRVINLALMCCSSFPSRTSCHDLPCQSRSCGRVVGPKPRR